MPGRWVAWGSALLLASILFVVTRGWGYDDPYITYRYGQNIAAGNGFVYNLGERSLSTTAPLYALILAGFRVFNFDIPSVSLLIGAVSLALGGLALWELGQIWDSPSVSWIGLISFPLFPLLVTTLGSESPLTLALALWGIVAYAARRYMPAAILLALAILCRADSVLILPILGVHYLVSHSKVEGADEREPFPWAAMGVGGLLLAGWFGFAWSYFGEPLPVTLAAKRAQGLMAISQSYWQGIGLLVGQYWASPLYRLPMLLSVVGLGWLIRRRMWLVILGWSGLHLVAYVALGVTRYYWYYAQLVPGIVVAVGLGVEVGVLSLRRWLGRTGTGVLTLLLVLGLGAIQANTIWQIDQRRDARLSVYREAGEWLQTNSPADAAVGALEVGIIGYFAQRTMIDFAGLLQPDVAHVFAPDTTYQDSARWAIEHYQPDYLVLYDGQLPGAQYAQNVVDACVQVHAISPDDDSAPLLILQCRW